MSTVSVLNTDSGLSGKTLVNAEDAQNVTGAKSFNRSPNPPFVVQAGSANVPNLDADKLDGQDWTSPTITTPTLTSPQINTTLKSASMFAGFCQGRLTLTTATPITTADVTGAATVYFTPYGGNLLALYDGSTKWTVYPFTEISLGLGTITNDLPYDVFVYDNAGTPTLEFLAWSSKTARATALVLQNGVLSKTGALTRRYLGTFHTTATTTTEDSFAKRLLWNYYNRVPRALRRLDSTASWTYTTLTWRQANASTANQVAVIVGVAEVPVTIQVDAPSSNSVGGTNIYGYASVGENSTTTPHTSCTITPGTNAGAGAFASGGAHSHLETFPAIGYSFYAWLEQSTAGTGTTTFYGTNAGVANGGIAGSIQG